MKNLTFAAAIVCLLTIVRGLASGQAVPTDRSIKDGVYTITQADRGRELYEARCAWCHGDDLTGKDMSPAVAGYVFDAKWNGSTLYELADRMRKTMPLQEPDTLTPQQNVDVLAYMLNMGRYPSGEKELPAESLQLRMIRFEPAY